MFKCCCAKELDPTKSKIMTPNQRFFLAYGLMGVCLLFMLTIGILGYSIGNQELLSGVEEAPASANGLAGIVLEQSTAVENLFINTLTGVLVPFFLSLNATIFQTINMKHLCGDMKAIEKTLYDLPQAEDVGVMLNRFDLKRSNMSTCLDYLSLDLTTANSEKLDLEKNISGLIGQLTYCDGVLNETDFILGQTLTIINDFDQRAGQIKSLAQSCSSDLGTIQRSVVPGEVC